MKMECGPNYSEYEDGSTLIGGNGVTAATAECVTMPTTTTGRIMDRNDALFQRSKGQWKCVDSQRHSCSRLNKVLMAGGCVL